MESNGKADEIRQVNGRKEGNENGDESPMKMENENQAEIWRERRDIRRWQCFGFGCCDGGINKKGRIEGGRGRTYINPGLTSLVDL